MPSQKGRAPRAASREAKGARRSRGGSGRHVRPVTGATTAGRDLLRSIPPVNELLEEDGMRSAVARHGRGVVVALLRERLSMLRAKARGRSIDRSQLERLVLDSAAWVDEEAVARTRSTITPVVNATGVVLHTNLGRAVLGESAVKRIIEVTRSYTTLEYDLTRGRRGSRSSHLDRLFAVLFPGRDVHVVNNNAAAVLLALNTLAEGKEVVVSRGELVEIGGSFRIPDIMRKSGAVLREIGSTNRTRLGDYSRALSPKTGLLLKVHPSNYRIVGFTEQVPLRDLVSLGRRRRIPVLMDQGSGNLLDLGARGIRNEPTVHEAVAAGADVVTFSGDKLLGGPQAGLLVGRPAVIRKLRDNPLSRALRVDKMTYAALEAALLGYVRGRPADDVPVARMVALTEEEIGGRARGLLERVSSSDFGNSGGSGDLKLSMRQGRSMLGGGSAPEEGLPTSLIAVTSGRLSARSIEERLRGHTPPVIARIEGQRVLIDLRTVFEEQDHVVEEAIASLRA